MRYVLTVDFEDDLDIESFLRFVKFHSNRLKCPSKDVFIRLSREWEAQQANGETNGSVKSRNGRKANQ